jgi:hypothetical protein
MNWCAAHARLVGDDGLCSGHRLAPPGRSHLERLDDREGDGPAERVRGVVTRVLRRFAFVEVDDGGPVVYVDRRDGGPPLYEGAVVEMGEVVTEGGRRYGSRVCIVQ